jgi:hypothetical protein
MSPPSIPSEYDDITFRSMTEARWAIVFRYLGITYEYEPQGFVTGVGRYLPDFLLADQSMIAEVKPSLDHDPRGVLKLRSLIEGRQRERGVILTSLFGDMRFLLIGRGDTWDDDGAALLTCPNGYHYDFQPYRQMGCGACGTQDGYWAESDKIREAFAFARSYRFDRR